MATITPLIDFAEALILAIKAGWDPLDPPATVERRDVSEETDNDLNAMTGRKVWVFPDGHNDRPLTRSRDQQEFQITIDVVEKYVSGTPGRVPQAWVDALHKWNYEQIWEKLTDPRSAAILDGFYPDEANVVPLVDKALLVGNKVFWSRTEIVFRSTGK